MLEVLTFKDHPLHRLFWRRNSAVQHERGEVLHPSTFSLLGSFAYFSRNLNRTQCIGSLFWLLIAFDLLNSMQIACDLMTLNVVIYL